MSGLCAADTRSDREGKGTQVAAFLVCAQHTYPLTHLQMKTEAGPVFCLWTHARDSALLALAPSTLGLRRLCKACSSATRR